MWHRCSQERENYGRKGSAQELDKSSGVIGKVGFPIGRQRKG